MGQIPAPALVSAVCKHHLKFTPHSIRGGHGNGYDTQPNLLGVLDIICIPLPENAVRFCHLLFIALCLGNDHHHQSKENELLSFLCTHSSHPCGGWFAAAQSHPWQVEFRL